MKRVIVDGLFLAAIITSFLYGCGPAPLQPGQCNSDSDCKSGQACITGNVCRQKCGPGLQECPPNLYCYTTQPVQDSDCEQGIACDATAIDACQ